MVHFIINLKLLIFAVTEVLMVEASSFMKNE